MLITRTTKKWGIALAMLIAPFFVHAQDVGVIKILNLSTGSCGASAQVIKVVINNYSATAQSNIPVKVDITGSGSGSVSSTYSKTLSGKAQDTVTLISSLNTSGGGTYTFKAYTTLSGDVNHTNDTLIQKALISPLPKDPIVSDTTRCGPGFMKVSIPRQKGIIGAWYASQTGNALVDTGTSISEVLKSSKTYYVENSSTYRDSLTAYPATGTSFTAEYGITFDVRVKRPLFLDSVSIPMYNSGTKDSVYLYYKSGTGNGYDADPTQWILAGKGFLTGKGGSKPVGMKLISPIMLKPGTYGFYLWEKTSNLNVYNVSSSDSNTNNDLTIFPGRYIYSSVRFGGKTVSTYSWRGTFYYKTFGCASARKKIYVRVKTGNAGAAIGIGSPFNGLFNAGSAVNPDKVCPNDTATYELTPPDAFTNFEYGTKWIVTDARVTLADGTPIASVDTMTNKPTASQNFSLRIIPSSKYKDTTLYLSFTVKSLVDSCVDVYSRVMRVGSLPTAYFWYSQVCEGLETTFIDSSSVPGNGYLSRIWDFGDGGSATQAYPTHTYAKAGTYNVTLKVTTGAGCSDVITRSVKVYAKPQMRFVTSPLCAGQVVDFYDSSITEGKILKYYWAFGENNATSKVASPTHTYLKPGKYTVTFAVTVSTGCVDTLRQVVTVVTKPTASFTYTNNCIGKPINFKSTSTGDTSMLYFWDFGDNTYSTDKNPTKTFYVGGKNKVTLTVQAGSSGCTDDITQDVTPYNYPTAKFGYTPACVNSPVAFSDSSDYANSSPATLRWYFGDGAIADNVYTPSHTYSSPGTYTVSLAITNKNGCNDSTSMDITVTTPPAADFTATTVCVGKPTVFSNKSTVSSGTLSYEWNFGDNTTSTDKDPQHTYSAVGTYSVTLKAKNSVCSSTKNMQVTVNPGPTPTWTTTHIGRKVTFTPDNTNYASYTWSFGDGDSSLDVAPYHLYKTATGSYDVTLIVTDDQGCTGKNTITFSFTGIESQQENPWGVSIYPNPFNGYTRVSYTLQKKGMVRVAVTDMQGREVLTALPASSQEAGKHDVLVDGSKLSAGMYMLKVYVDEQCYNARIIQLK